MPSYLIIIFITITQQACAMNSIEKHLSLDINSQGLDYYIKFNDVDVHSVTDNGSIIQKIDVNQWAVNGENTILVSVNLRDEDKKIKLKNAITDKLTVSLVLTEYINDKEVKHVLSTFDLQPSESDPETIGSSTAVDYYLDSEKNYTKTKTGDIAVSNLKSEHIDEWLDFTQSIKIDIGLPKWEYLSGDYIGENGKFSKEGYRSIIIEVYAELERLHDLMNDKDLTAMLKLTRLRSQELDAAFHLPPGTKQNEMEDSLTSAFNHEALYLDDLVAKNRVSLISEAHGKIVHMITKGIGGPVMYYSHKDEAFTRYYDFYFMKKNGKLIIIR